MGQAVAVAVRRATRRDIAALVALRRVSSEEDPEDDSDLATFDVRMSAFLDRALDDGHWRIFVGEIEGEVVATAYMQVIPKVPRPWPNPPWGYVTSVFTLAAHRDRGIGSAVLTALRAHAESEGLEGLLLWPSQRSIPFYERLGFRSDETLELELPRT